MEISSRHLIRWASSAFLCLLAVGVLSAQQKVFDGDWQMDAAKSHVSDGRSLGLTIASIEGGIKLTFTTKKSDGQEVVSGVITKLDGKACDFDEGAHKSQLTFWYDGTALNASKEKGPATDVTSMWKFELAPDKRSMTLTINHYEPAADDEKLVFNKKS